MGRRRETLQERSKGLATRCVGSGSASLVTTSDDETMWSATLAEPAERHAFYSLLDEYFSRPTPSSAPLPSRRAIPTYTPASTLTTVEPVSLSSRASGYANSAADKAGPSIANAALKNTTASSAALRQAGLSPAAAASLASFGSKNSTVLAPHLAKAATAGAKEGWKNKAAIASGVGTAAGYAPPVKGPAHPTGLSSSRTIAGGFDTGNGGKGVSPPSRLSSRGMRLTVVLQFGKTLWGSKGPMSSEEAKKNVFREPLAVRAGAKQYAPPTSGHTPPPSRGGALAPPPVHPKTNGGIGNARAVYDYDGTVSDRFCHFVLLDPDTRTCRTPTTSLSEKETPLSYSNTVSPRFDSATTSTTDLDSISPVSDDWWKCRSSDGQEGLVPVTYLSAV